jgi:hypothetical protein
MTVYSSASRRSRTRSRNAALRPLTLSGLPRRSMLSSALVPCVKASLNLCREHEEGRNQTVSTTSQSGTAADQTAVPQVIRRSGHVSQPSKVRMTARAALLVLPRMPGPIAIDQHLALHQLIRPPPGLDVRQHQLTEKLWHNQDDTLVTIFNHYEGATVETLLVLHIELFNRVL